MLHEENPLALPLSVPLRGAHVLLGARIVRDIFSSPSPGMNQTGVSPPPSRHGRPPAPSPRWTRRRIDVPPGFFLPTFTFSQILVLPTSILPPAD